MRRISKILLASGMALMLTSQAHAVAVDLLPDNASPTASDSVTFTIQATLEASDAVTGIFVTIDSSGASFVSGTEQAFNFVNGVLLTPIGAPGSDIGPILDNPNRIGGFEAQTLSASGAPGPATFTIGSATYHIGGAFSLTMDTSIGDPGGTVVGGVDFADISNDVAWGNIVPEPTTAGLLSLGLFGLVLSGRRRI